MDILYQYRALDEQGAVISGALEASNEKDAFRKLSAKGLSPFEIKVKAKPLSVRFARERVTQDGLSRYLRQLATLLSANVTILDAVTTLTRTRSNPVLAVRSQEILSDLRAGRKLSASLEEKMPEFPDYVFRLSDLGEATGSLAKALTDAADRMEYEQQVRSDIRSAMAYPLFLLAMGAVIVTLMFIFVVPRFATLLGDDFANAPWISRTVIGSGLWLKENALIVFGGGVLIVISIVLIARAGKITINVRDMVDKFPVIGLMLRNADLGGWCRTVGVALSNKALLVNALELAESGTRSKRFQRMLQRARSTVRAGRPLEEALLEADPDFEPMIIDLIKTGRNAGTLADMLLFSAALYEKEARERTKQLTALAEPVAIVGIAIIVGVVVVSIVLAMTTLYDIDF